LAVDVPVDVPNFSRDVVEQVSLFEAVTELGPEDFGQCLDREVEGGA